MSAQNNNASRLYVVKETSPGTIKAPSSGSEALALQPGFEFVPNSDTQVNEELRAGIGPAKPILGIEKPTASFSHYLRAAGAEATYPDFDYLLESIFGTKSQNSTQRTLTSSSTTTLLKLAAGGSDFARGKAVLVKDGTNGYSIRPVDSVSTNDLTLGFALGTAPASGVTCGKCTNYTPANTGHPTLSLWLYRANGGAIEAIQGALVTQLDIELDVGNLLKMNFQAGGTKFFFDPIEITASTKYVDFVDDGGTKAASVATGIYRSPIALATALAAAMTAASANTITVTYNSHGANAGKFTLSSNGTTFTLKWNTGTNTANSIASKVGFSTAADSSGATSYDSSTAQSWSDALTPSLDSADPLVAKDMEILIGDQSDYISLCVQTMKGSIALDTSDVKCISATTGIDSKVVKKRNSSFEITALLSQHEASLFDRYINNTATKFLFNFGSKDSAGNWNAGYCGCIYSPAATITGYRVGDSDGAAVYLFTVSPYMDSSGNPEVYLNLL